MVSLSLLVETPDSNFQTSFYIILSRYVLSEKRTIPNISFIEDLQDSDLHFFDVFNA